MSQMNQSALAPSGQDLDAFQGSVDDKVSAQVFANKGTPPALQGGTYADDKTIEHERQVIQRAFSFDLRGNSLNPIIDTSSPLLALIVRIASLRSHENLEDMHKRMLHELESIELELHREGYDRVTILAHRYCLCSAIDEAVMNSPWGQESSWSEHSLLAIFHNETWGGEKFFVILDRMLMEPNRYLDLLEFLYTCLSLGYEGRYRVIHNGRVQLEAVIKEVYSVIRKTRGTPDQVSLLYGKNITEKLHQVIWQTPIPMVIAGALLAGAIVYGYFFYYMDMHIDGTLAELSKILGQ